MTTGADMLHNNSRLFKLKRCCLDFFGGKNERNKCVHYEPLHMSAMSHVQLMDRMHAGGQAGSVLH